MNALDSYIAGSESTPTIGAIVMYTVSGAQAPHAIIRNCCISHGMPIPAEPTDRNTFARVTSKSEVAARHTRDSESMRYLVRKAKTKNNLLVATVIAESIARPDEEELDYDYQQTVEVVFDPANGRTSLRDAHISDEVCQEIAADIMRRYEAERGCVTSYTLRELIRGQLLESASAMPVRKSGGVYFVPEWQQQRLEQIVGFVECLPGDSQINVIPLVDNENQREMVRAAFIRNTQSTLHALMQEASAPAMNNRLDRMRSDYLGLVKQANDYRNLVGEAIEEVEAAVELLGIQLGMENL